MTNEFAWFLGWLLSDGSITVPKYKKKGDETHLQFCIHHKDREILDKIKTILNTRAKVHVYPHCKSPQSKLRIYDRKDIVKNYANIKTEIPVDIAGFERHFMRGLVDGDGCLHQRKNRDSFQIQFINAEENIVEWFSKTLHEKVFVPYKKPSFKKKDNLYYISWEGRFARIIAWYLYHGNIEHMSLQRKLDYYHQHVLNNTVQKNEKDLLAAAKCNLTDNKIHMNVPKTQSLEWCHIIQNLYPYNTTPVPLNKGQGKYYALHISEY